MKDTDRQIIDSLHVSNLIQETDASCCRDCDFSQSTAYAEHLSICTKFGENAGLGCAGRLVTLKLSVCDRWEKRS